MGYCQNYVETAPTTVYRRYDVGVTSEKLSELSSSELHAFVLRGGLSEQQALDALRNPYCGADTAELIADSRELLMSHTVRELLGGFRGMPVGRAMDLIATLPWTSLVALAQNPRTPPVIRRHCEKKLVSLLLSMSLGEKVALARRVHRPLVKNLIASADGQVLTALLDNQRICEEDVLLMINTAPAPAEFYSDVARHSRWGQCYGVRRALATCPNAPLPVALSALVQLRTRDISATASRPDVPDLVRSAARALKEKEDKGLRRVIRSGMDDSRGDLPHGSDNLR